MITAAALSCTFRPGLKCFDDLAATGWTPQFDAMRRTIAPESAAVRAFSDECRFWLAQKEPVGRLPSMLNRAS